MAKRKASPRPARQKRKVAVARTNKVRPHRVGRILIRCNARPYLLAMALLKQLAEVSPEIVRSFLSGLDSLAQLCCVNSHIPLALGAGELRVLLQPSDLLRDFLAASGTGDIENVAVKI